MHKTTMPGLAVFACACGLLACLALAGCSGGAASYADGTYVGQSEVYEDEDDGNGNGYGVATVTIEDGQVVSCDFKTYEPDGTLKDETYGMTNGGITNQDFYNKAQKAVVASREYAEQLVAKGGQPDVVDAISGATISYNEFLDAVQIALDKAAH